MARAGILYSHVTKAAAQLVAAGKNPTVDNVREQLGGTGSKSTIAPLLKQWKAQHQGEVTAVGAGLPVDLLEAVKGVYERMQADAQRQVDMARAENQTALEAVGEQLRQCQAHDGMLSQSAAALSAELAQTKEALARLQGAHQAEQITVATLRSDNAGMEQRLADRATEVKALVEQLAQARVQFEHFQEAIAAQRLDDRQTFDRHAGRLEHNLASAQQRLLAQQTTVSQQATQLMQLRGEAARNIDEARATREELTAAQADRVQLTRQLAEASASVETIAAKLEVARQEEITVRLALAAQEKQTELTNVQLDIAGAKLEKLDQERLALIQTVATIQANERNR